MTATPHTPVAGVIGWPVAHSLSPALHRFWLREHEIAGAYVPLPVQPHDFAVAIRGLIASGLAGVNVTLPHKQAAFALANAWDEAAERAGAANLLLFRDSRVEARNTDIEGLAASLATAFGSDDFSGKAVIILGAGGAARSAVLACARLKFGVIDVMNRTPARAQSLVRSIFAGNKGILTASGLSEWNFRAPQADLVINTTSAGLAGAPSMNLALDRLPASAAVCDLVYNPPETPLLAHARRCGLKAIDGLGMLMHQAVPAFEAFYGVRPQVTPALRDELERLLGG